MKENVERRMQNADGKSQVKKFTDLKVWQENRKLVNNVYWQTRLFPREELYGLTSQLRRAAISISSNIAEGFRRDTMKDKIHFNIMAHGLHTEVQNQLILSKDLSYMTEKQYNDSMAQSELVDKLLTGLIRASKERL